MKNENHNRNAARTLFATALLATLLTPAQAKTGLPVVLGMGSADALAAGKPATVYVEIHPSASYSHAQFRLVPSTSWQILDGMSYWSGPLADGQPVKFQFRVVPAILHE